MNPSVRADQRLILGVAVVLLLAPALALADTTLQSRILDVVQAEAEHVGFPGAILVAENGRTVYTGAFGEANRDYHIPIVLETKFNISSVQKTFIATATMQLHQEGMIDLDDSLTKYYPDCPWEQADQIHITHLLNHTSGLADYRDNEEYQRNADRYTCIEDVIPLVWRLEPGFTPGDRFKYSNAGVLLLKGIIEKATGKKLKEVIAGRIWHPLGMTNSTFYAGGDVLPKRATAYVLAADGKSYRRVVGEPSAYAGGGIYTTVLDLLKFDQALHGEELLSEANKAIMFTPVEASPSYACGWEVAERAGSPVISHSGGSGGFNAEFRRYPEQGYTLIVLSSDGDAGYYLANKLERLLLGLPYAAATVADSHFRRGMHFQNQGLYAEAIESFGLNTQIEPPHLASLYQAARTRIIGEFDQKTAIDLLDRYISLSDESAQPSQAAAWWRKGVAYEQLGKTDEAIRCHERCLELDEAWSEATEALARLRKNK